MAESSRPPEVPPPAPAHSPRGGSGDPPRESQPPPESPPPDTPPPDEVTLRLSRHERLSFRAWFYAFILLLAVLAAVRLVSGKTSEAAALAGLFAYLSLACTFFPLPTAWIIIWAAAPVEGHGLGLHPLIVAGGGAAATAIANMHDYYLLTFLYRYRPVQKVRATPLYRRVAVWYNRAPFAALAAASFLPIPIDFVRLLAISEGYSRWKFALGSLVGRWPRYLALAVLADQFKLGWQWVLGIAGATIVLGLWRGLPPIVRWISAKMRGRPGVSNNNHI
jgi:membrane protein YqaA with SNARE-associated domain